jgi:hypothetical protein
MEMINFGKPKGGKIMKKMQATNKRFGLELLVIVAVFLVIFPCQAGAQTEDELCALVGAADNGADYDNDGFTDYQECNGITLYNGTPFPGFSSGELRANRLGPADQDLFVILISATDVGLFYSNFPSDPLLYVSRSVPEGGLGITTHLIPFSEANPDRFVSPDSPQKAVRITEDLNADGIVLGVANQGTPNGLDEASIFTERIKNHVQSTCAEADEPLSDNCTDSATGFSGQELIDLYIRHTIAHEIGHMTMLAVEYNRRFGGYHYKAGSEVILEQAVKYTSKKGKVTFYISTQYAEPSQLGVQLQ